MEGQKARLLLLWPGDKGLEIYNTAIWDVEADQFKVNPIFEKLHCRSIHKAPEQPHSIQVPAKMSQTRRHSLGRIPNQGQHIYR